MISVRIARMLLAVPSALAAVHAAAAAPLPAAIDPARLGAPTFTEDFRAFDWGTDQARPARPHRWRTVYGSGGAMAFDNRKMSGTSFATDANFQGVRDGAPGPRALGLDPFVLDPGHSLTILAQRTPPVALPYVWNKPYWGGAMTTKFSFSQLFGYFELEAMLPKGRGFWPAFWLMPSVGKWPMNGELDILEQLGDPHLIYCTVISGRQKQVQTKVPVAADLSAGFHRFGAAWGPDEIVWYVDRREVARTPTPADMKHEPMHVIANLAIGGAWGGYPDAATHFPGKYVLRRITVWKLPGM